MQIEDNQTVQRGSDNMRGVFGGAHYELTESNLKPHALGFS
jgi:hypothetical protein